MILLFAVVVGLVAGVLNAWLGKRQLQPPHLHLWWLIPLAFLPQLLSFRLLPFNLNALQAEWAPAVLVGSQLVLLIFACANWRQAGMWALGLGLTLNLLVIVLNGGLMPITPEHAAYVWTDAPPDFIQVGRRVGLQKGIVLLTEQTRLWFLSDIFTLPPWFPIFRAAFSPGDALIAIGAFLFLWSMGAKHADASLPQADAIPH